MKQEKSFLIYPLIMMAFILTMLNSCRHGDEIIQPLPSKYNIVYMDYPTCMVPSSENGGNVILEYKGKKIVKRKGGIVMANPATGYNYKFLKDMYDTLVYSDNKLVIKGFLNFNGSTIRYPEKTIIFDKHSRIIKKIKKDEYGITDTTNYYYNSKGLLIKTEIKNPYKVQTSNFYYSSKNNIDSIISTHYIYNIIEEKIIEYFNNFDEAPNTLRHLMIFDETFNRSLSCNNYLSYKKIVYNRENVLQEKIERTNTIYYDEQGFPFFYLK